MSNDEADQLAEFLRLAKRILVFTGAGISTGSGIRDFRGPNGVWKERQPVYYDQFMSSEAARVEYWDYKAESWPSMRDAVPNAVHEGIVDLERAGKLLMVVTQNIDGLHSRAGLSRERLIELHGSNGRIECQSCHAESEPDPHFEDFKRTGRAPLCACGGYLKPATISFGQNLRTNDLKAAEQAARDADFVVSLGSSLSVYPASEIPLLAARREVPYAVVNRGPTDHDGFAEVSLRIEGDVLALFPPAVEHACAAS
jgi:NAD-dependent deacetylase